MSGKSTWGNRLLISLIPLGVLGVVAFIAYAISVSAPGDEIDSPWEVFWTSCTFFIWLAWWIALPTGIVLKVWGGAETRRVYREARQYAEMHNWQQISDTTWKGYRPRNVVMTVSQAFERPTYILSVEHEGESVTTDGFSRSVYALRFADFLWDHVMSGRSHVDAEAMRAARREWGSRYPQLSSGR